MSIKYVISYNYRNYKQSQIIKERGLKMSNVSIQIANLITYTGKTGPEMTHALKALGGGDMQKGITRIAEYFLAKSPELLKRGRIQGAIGGITCAAVLLLIAKLYNQSKKNTKLNAEGEAILKTLKDNLPESSNSEEGSQAGPTDNLDC